MRRTSAWNYPVTVLAALAVAVGLATAPEVPAAAAGGPDEVIIYLEPGTDPAPVAAAVGGSLKDVLEGANVARITVPGSAAVAIDRLSRLPGVELAEPLGPQDNVVAQEAEFDFDGSAFDVITNAAQTDYSNQWAAAALKLSQAHQRATGTGVVVAVLDTGLDVNHPALAGAVSSVQCNFLASTSCGSNVADIGNGADDDGDRKIDEAVGHGTFIAGLVRLAAPGATIMPLRVLNSDGVGDAINVAAAIRYAADHGAKVLNLSFGAEKSSKVLQDALDYARAKGATVVASTGNSAPGKNNRGVLYPARYGSALAVISTEQANVVYANALLGKEVDLGAPGVLVVSFYPGGQYARATGTSMAAGLASGAAAVVRGQYPGWTDAQVQAKLKSTVQPYTGLANNQKHIVGAGVIDLAAAMR